MPGETNQDWCKSRFSAYFSQCLCCWSPLRAWDSGYRERDIGGSVYKAGEDNDFRVHQPHHSFFRSSECLPSYYKVYKRRRDSASPLLGSVIVPSATSKYETMELYEGTASLRKWGSPQHVDTHAAYFPGIGKVDFSQASLPIHERHTANQSVTLMLILTTTWPVFHQWKDHTALTQTSLDATIQFGMNANQTWH
ncbi:hypothetical protein F5141DRAFT_1066427 [Pisolithus sp. B1]|nr:hypothetical protein F5141DRAFT_1066427 [Pisolithus sp. B1]